MNDSTPRPTRGRDAATVPRLDPRRTRRHQGSERDQAAHDAHQQKGQPALAAPLLKRALEPRERLLEPASPKIAEAQVALATGDVAQARTLAASAAAIHARHEQRG